MGRFSEEVRGWFLDAFEEPTDVQVRAWDAIAVGGDALVIAPTGSGKTLAAFLFAIDRLMAEKAAARTWERGVRVLYVSPLKALAADVERNLAAPLAGIAERMEADPGVTVGMRTGDTPAGERAKQQRRPPDIMITTPESLYLLLTSKAREGLSRVQAVIVDEIHSIASSKRGAHLALSLERLDDLVGHPVQRVGLSATVEPREEVARFLGGIQPVDVVASEVRKTFDMQVRVPVKDMTAIPSFGEGSSASIWPYIEAAILDEVLEHRSTIVFVNSRGLCERLTARLNDAYSRRVSGKPSQAAIAEMATSTLRASFGPTSELAGGTEDVIAKAHHGSVSKEKRASVERELKRGDLRCVVATSSLELGIDMGEVDLVMQVAPPPSVASGLQRIGRANHQVAGSSRGIIYPKVRTEIVDAAVTVEGMREGLIERTRLVADALDVLAQQTVAAVSMCPDGLDAGQWYATVRRAANYADLSRGAFDAVIGMLCGRFASGDIAEFAPRIAFDAESGLLMPLSRSQRLAVTAGGTIPDRGQYPVMLPEGDASRGRRRVGELDEEMVHESRVGDTIILGTSTWRIREITADRVIVEPAPGRQARLPFWHGETVGLGYDEALRRGAFLRAMRPGAAGESDQLTRLREDGLDAFAQGNLTELLREQQAATGAIPDDATIVVERCADEAGDARIIIHAPFGRRVHEPWALAIAKHLRDVRGFDPQAMATDTGIVLRVPASEDGPVPLADLLLGPDEAEAIVRESIGSTSLFAARFRECAARALLVSARDPRKRAPLWEQRVKGGQLLEAARREGDFPLLAEAARECLQDAYDLRGMREGLQLVAEGRVRVHEADTDVPSPFAAPLLFGYVAEHLYEGDLPHAERRNALLSMDPGLLGELLGGERWGDVLDADVVRSVSSELQHTAAGRRFHGVQGAWEMLRELGPLSVEEAAQRLAHTEGDADDAEDGSGDGRDEACAPEEAREILEELMRAHRAFPVRIGGREAWAAAEDAPRLAAVLGCPVPDWAAGPGSDAASDGDRMLDGLTARVMRTDALLTAEEAARRIGLGRALVEESLGRLAGEGRVCRVRYPSDAAEPSWADTGILRRLRARSLAAARAAVQPVSAQDYLRFLFKRQGLCGEGLAPGIDGVAEVIAQFEGVFLPAQLWEGAIFPSRVKGYAPAMLDELLESGDVVWSGKTGDSGQCSVAFYPTDSPFCPILRPLERDIDRAELRGMLWHGEAAVDSFALARSDIDGMRREAEAMKAPRRSRSRRSGARYASMTSIDRVARARVRARAAEDASYQGNWSAALPPDADGTLRALSIVDSLLDRYGLITRDLALLDGVRGGLGGIYPVLRHMEDSGDVLRGVFVEGLGGAQFASLAAVDDLRADAGASLQEGEAVVLAADDPANVLGAAIPWPTAPGGPKPARKAGATVTFVDGQPIMYATAHLRELLIFCDDERLVARALAALTDRTIASAKREGSQPRERIQVKAVNGQPTIDSPLVPLLERAGFVRNGLDMRLHIPYV